MFYHPKSFYSSSNYKVGVYAVTSNINHFTEKSPTSDIIHKLIKTSK